MAANKEKTTSEVETAAETAAETAVETAAETAAVGSPEWWNENVPIKLFKDTKDYKDDVFVGINGKTWQIKRGVEVMVPRYVAKVIEDGYQQDLETAALIEGNETEFTDKSKALGLETE